MRNDDRKDAFKGRRQKTNVVQGSTIGHCNSKEREEILICKSSASRRDEVGTKGVSSTSRGERPALLAGSPTRNRGRGRTNKTLNAFCVASMSMYHPRAHVASQRVGGVVKRGAVCDVRCALLRLV